MNSLNELHYLMLLVGVLVGLAMAYIFERLAERLVARVADKWDANRAAHATPSADGYADLRKNAAEFALAVERIDAELERSRKERASLAIAVAELKAEAATRKTIVSALRERTIAVEGAQDTLIERLNALEGKAEAACHERYSISNAVDTLSNRANGIEQMAIERLDDLEGNADDADSDPQPCEPCLDIGHCEHDEGECYKPKPPRNADNLGHDALEVFDPAQPPAETSE